MLRKVQIIPRLVSVETNTQQIPCFSFWNDPKNATFFAADQSSEFFFTYRVSSKINVPEERPLLQFSNLSYRENNWSYYSRKWGMKLLFHIDERAGIITANHLYHKIFIKIGALQPIGYILSDYLRYKFEQVGKFHIDGAAGHLNDKTCLFFGFGRNFKTTLVDLMLDNGGYYIGEEFILLSGNQVYSTMPVTPNFDWRKSGRGLLSKNLKRRKLDVSEYQAVFFLVYSNRDEIKEIDRAQANQLVYIHRYTTNTYYYDFFRARDLLLNRAVPTFGSEALLNDQAKYYVARFTDIQKVLSFIKSL